MDILTGSSGFLGSTLKKSLPKVVCIPHEQIRSSRIESFNNFYFLSTYGNMSWHTEDEKIIKANLLDLIHVLGQIKWEEIHSFVYVSSSSVKRKVQTMYSRMKKAAEEVLLSYAEKYNAPIAIVRPLSITGIGDQKEHLIPTLIRSALEESSMPFVSDAYHDYIDVEDVVSGILALSEHRARGVFELGTGISRSNREVREVVEKLVGKEVNTQEVTNMRSYDSSEWVCSNFKARQYGWEPKKPFEQTIKEMVTSYVDFPI
jgi:nucleoside-diphosphate-sugar epimerase